MPAYVRVASNGECLVSKDFSGWHKRCSVFLPDHRGALSGPTARGKQKPIRRLPLISSQTSYGGDPMRSTSGSLLAIFAVLYEPDRSEEHTSELQSLTNLVCRLLLEKKKYKRKPDQHAHQHKSLHAGSP